MPRTVDHEQRRGEIAAAVSRIAMEKGLQGVSFREVATEAGMSVSLVQHYFGSKANLLFGTLEIVSARFAELITTRLRDLAHGNDPMQRLGVIAACFIPTNDESRSAMLLYHSFATAALTDHELRRADGFRNARSLTAAISHELTLAQQAGSVQADIDPGSEATVILSLVLGLSLAVLLEQTTSEQALAVLNSHLARL